ncbi:MAG: Ig-like domain-containing protein [Eubacteriales bacterium]
MKLHHSVRMKIILTALITLILTSLAISAGAVTYTYDKLNRLTSATYANGQKLTYTYDAGGNMVSVSHTGGPQNLSVKSTIPADNDTGVPVGQDISVTFRVYVQPGSAYGSISVTDAAYNPVGFVKAVNDDTLTLYLTSSLEYSTRYIVTIHARAVTDTVNNDLPEDYSFSFTTEDREFPVVISTDPADNETGVLPDQKISVTFSVYVQPGSAYDSISVRDAVYKPVKFTKAISGDTLTITPKGKLKYHTRYTVTIPARAVTDDVNSDLPADYSFSFTTKGRKSLSVTATDPANKAAGVPVDKTVAVTFSENVLEGENFDNISLGDCAGNPAAFNKNISGSVLFLDPVEDLAGETTYKVNIPAGAVKDASGNILKQEKTFRFTTWDKTPPTVDSSHPDNYATGVQVHKIITVTFSEEIQEGAAYGSITLKDARGNPVDATNIIRKNKLVIIPGTSLDYNTRYTVTVPAHAVKDMAGNGLAGDFTLSFTTRTHR